VIFPVWHERMELRRLPAVTLAIALGCLVLQGWIASREDAARACALDVATRAANHWTAHPYLEARPPLDAVVASAAGTVSEAAERPRSQAVVDAEQRELDALADELRAAVDATPTHQWGWIPRRGPSVRLLTYPFVHDGWWHLLSNLWFLLLAGVALEDRWGRLPFLAFYLAAGAFAAVAHGCFASDRSAALVGASGAVAGAMGAFLMLFARARVRFAALLGVRVVTFDAPAWATLPVWSLAELGGALLDRASDTAHGAHVGGFVFGAVIARGLRVAGIDRRLDLAAEKAAVPREDSRIEAALLLEQRGERDQALAMLEGLIKERPGSVHAWEALRDVADRAGDAKRASEAAQKARALLEQMT
jgi:membrane associated rhomboid family serine protease